MITLLLFLIIMQVDFDWGAAERAVREDRARSVALDTMRTDTTTPDYLHFKAPKKEKKSVHNVLILDTKDIDSVQAIEDSLEFILYSDSQYKKMRGFNVTDRIGFFNHLLHYKIRDTADVQRATRIYIEILNCQYQKLILILENQTDDSRAAIYPHIKKNRNDTGVIGAFLYEIT